MMFHLVLPIIVPYWQKLGLSIEEIFKLQAIFGICIITFDLPMGYVSDLFSRRACLMMVGILNIIGFQFLYHGSTYIHFVYFEIFMALTFAIYSGSDIALIYDSLDSEKEKGEMQGVIIGKKVFYVQMGETVAAILGGALATYYLKLPAMINMFTAAIPFFIAMTLVEPVRKKLNKNEHRKNFIFILKSMFGHSRFLNSLILFNIVYGLATYIAVWIYQPYWRELNIPLHYFGFLWAGSNFIVAIVARRAIYIEKKLSTSLTLALISILPVLAYLGMGLIPSIFSLFFIILISLSRALNTVVLQDGINARVPSEIRATANSFCSLGMRGSFIFLGPSVGRIIDREGPSEAMIYIGYIYIVVFFLVSLPLLLQKKHYRKFA